MPPSRGTPQGCVGSRLPRAVRAPLPRSPRSGRTAGSSVMKTEQERAAQDHHRTRFRRPVVRIRGALGGKAPRESPELFNQGLPAAPVEIP